MAGSSLALRLDRAEAGCRECVAEILLLDASRLILHIHLLPGHLRSYLPHSWQGP